MVTAIYFESQYPSISIFIKCIRSHPKVLSCFGVQAMITYLENTRGRLSCVKGLSSSVGKCSPWNAYWGEKIACTLWLEWLQNKCGKMLDRDIWIAVIAGFLFIFIISISIYLYYIYLYLYLYYIYIYITIYIYIIMTLDQKLQNQAIMKNKKE